MTKKLENSTFSLHSHAQIEQVRDSSVRLSFDIKANHYVYDWLLFYDTNNKTNYITL